MRPIRVLIIALLASLIIAAPVAAAKPLMEKITLSDLDLVDEFLSDACGFEVRFDGTGHVIFRVWFDDEGNPVREVNNFGIHITYRSQWGSVSVVDVGADRVAYHPDGSITFSAIGNIQSIQHPGQGRVWSDVGRVTFHVTFPPEGDPIFELVSLAGQHADTPFEDTLCELLAP